MHDLTPLTALGHTAPCRDDIGNVTIIENPDLALASVAARLGEESACEKLLGTLLGEPAPTAGRAQTGAEFSAMWLGPDQWMLFAPLSTREMLAEAAAAHLGKAASVTEQNDAWVCFDIEGTAVCDLFERLSAVPIRKMQTGEARRTVIDHLGCLLIILEAQQKVRIFGPRSSAQSLHHALTTAARSIV